MKNLLKASLAMFRKPIPPTPNIVVYTLLDSDAAGNLRAFPVGSMPRLSKEMETKIVEDAKGEMYFGVDIEDDSAIACVANNRVDALCFFAPDIAGRHAHKLFDTDFLSAINKSEGMFDHFPRSKLADDH